ncbi:PP2C family protein-serine/threonine phosphatase [Curtobacterium sp. VKM Ac-2922]|uniref:PP2C family protein-serine/threonine phosphatase n=1 Tax=Curtobacterium sp. VKM Ac-2922 TaxID=2929475 RepID=UPI001FB47834|nr:SpoIIE family protein phosphatase [Curtobacterium sp. VKM Ac-2922]MCJ1714144.1 SpoIIE family protein phosphatase [Curtobacterium sp. VKM Ac-2922]
MSRPTSITDSALVRQVPISVLLAVAVLVSALVPTMQATDTGTFLTSILVAAVATVVAAVAAAMPRVVWLVPVVLVLDFAAMALLRTGTGANTSVFTSLVVLPVVWWASLSGWRTILWSVLGVVAVILAPYVLLPSMVPSISELVRLGITATVFGTVAVVVHELARQARSSVRRAERREKTMAAEIARAAEVQRSLLPTRTGSGVIPEAAPDDDAIRVRTAGDLDVAGACLPARSVGGDFFDWYATEHGLAVTLGDVMGKGVGAGLIAAAVRTTLRSARTVDDPSEALRRASDGLSAEDGGGIVAFTTLFHARLDDDGTLRWADAGHGLSFVLRADDGVERLRSVDLPLGLGIRDEWATTADRLEPGDLLISFSDGVLDLFGGRDDAVDAVAAIARRHGHREPATLVAALSDLADEVPHDDDVTVVVLRRQPAHAELRAALGPAAATTTT